MTDDGAREGNGESDPRRADSGPPAESVASASSDAPGDDDADRRVTYALVGVALLAVAALALLVYVAGTGGGGGATPARDVQWELHPVNDTYVRIVHAGGPTISPEGLTVTVDGLERQARWSDSTLSEGDYGVVRVGRGTRVTLHLRQDRVSRVTVDRWTLDGSAGIETPPGTATESG